MPKRTDISTILIIGAGPIVIGQACEFDYSGTQAVKTLKEEGYRIVLVNSNPATIMTDPEFADRTYVEPITPEVIEAIMEREKPDAILPTLGGQTALNAAMELNRNGALARHSVKLIGANAQAIAKGEDRQLFKEAMLRIGLEVPRSGIARSLADLDRIVAEIGTFPLIIRPAFTLGGTGGGIAYNGEELAEIAGRGLAIVDAPNGSIVGYSTAPGMEAADGDGNHSPYTSAFLNIAREPNLPIEQLFKRVRLEVNHATRGRQTPWESSSLTSDFYFFGDTAVAGATRVAAAVGSDHARARGGGDIVAAVDAVPDEQHLTGQVRVIGARPGARLDQRQSPGRVSAQRRPQLGIKRDRRERHVPAVRPARDRQAGGVDEALAARGLDVRVRFPEGFDGLEGPARILANASSSSAKSTMSGFSPYFFL